MRKYFHFLLAFLVISILIAEEGEAENETNEDESNETSSNDNGTNDNTTSGNNETKEESSFCPAEITDENENLVEESCLATFDEPAKSKDDEDKGFLPSLSLLVSICAIAIIAFRRR